jgi:putative endonuclease
VKSAWVYILSSRSGVLYIGVTSDLDRRIFEHRNGIRSGFASRYHCHKLVFCESFQYLTTAIAREKTLKDGREPESWR